MFPVERVLMINMDASLLTQRARLARMKSDWYAGRAERHPHGLSGLRHLLPRDLTQDCRDTAPHAFRFSEWGNHAAISVQIPRSPWADCPEARKMLGARTVY